MADIYWGLAIIATLAVGVFALTLWLTRKLPQYVNDLLALAAVIGIFAYIHYLWYNTRLLAILPFSNLVILGNWFPLAAAVLGGLAWHRIPGVIFRKALFVGGLACTSAYSLLWPMMGESPLCMNVWRRDLCVQTTAKTCTPACAATLLRAHGIDTTEREMADLCLTREGTTWMGLYRGLKLKTAHTQWDVEVASCNVDELLRMQGPVIVSVGLPSQPQDTQQVAMSEWGWKRGIGHSVLLWDQTKHGRARIADPTPGVGFEEWTMHDMRLLYRGTAVRLVKRS